MVLEFGLAEGPGFETLKAHGGLYLVYLTLTCGYETAREGGCVSGMIFMLNLNPTNLNF